MICSGIGWALGLDEGQVWGGCAELVMPGEVVTLGGRWEGKTRTNICSDGSSFGFEWGV